MTLVRRAARPLLASIFLVGGLDALRHPASKTEAAEPVVQALAKPLGLPEDTELLVRANAAAMLLGGGLLAIGRVPRLASALLAATIVPTTVAGHPFWTETDPAKRKQQTLQFAKNASILGGVLLAAVDTAGKPGLAYRAKMMADSAGRTRNTVAKDAKHAASTARREARLKIAQASDALG